MSRRTQSTHFILALCAVISSCGCGKVEYSSRSYEPLAPAAGSGAANAYLTMTPTRSETGGRFGRTIRIGEPYEVGLKVDTSKEYPDPVELLSLVVERGGAASVIHDRSTPARTARLTKTPNGPAWNARISVPLGKQLEFADGSTLKVTAVVRLPYERGETTIVRSFIGKTEVRQGSNLDTFAGQ